MGITDRDIRVEVAVFGGNEAITAQGLGAHRVELNAPGSYGEGGLTPPLSELRTIAPFLEIPVRIMIRPVGAPLGENKDDFIYTDAQIQQMKDSITDFKKSGYMNPLRGDGFVFGVLAKATPPSSPHSVDVGVARLSLIGSDSGGSGSGSSLAAEEKNLDQQVATPTVLVDKALCAVLTAHAKPFPCVFHRAFDPIAASPSACQRGLRDLVDCKFEGLLTSGGPGPFSANMHRLPSLLDHGSAKLQVIVGGGLRANNVELAVKALLSHCAETTLWLHSACRVDGGESLAASELGQLMQYLRQQQRE